MDDPLLGRLIAQRYRLISRLGVGGMASVYLARHVLIDRLNAIKFLRTDLSKLTSYRDRFLREAKAVNRINHPNIVEISDYGEAEGLVFLVMEYVPGEPLTKHLSRGPLGYRRTCAVGVQLASALGRAHQMGVIHRDLKPGNVLLVDRRDGSDLAKLTDFGVAKISDSPTITTTNVALGTPGYVAPEYARYGAIDPRNDLFSLGVLLYEATCGELPYDARTPPSTMTPPPIPLSQRDRDVPAFFDEVVLTLLAPDPDDRPRDGFEALDLLRRASPVASVTLMPMAGGITVPTAEFGALGVDVTRPGPPPPARAQSRTGPHLTTAPVERVAPMCTAAWAKLEAVSAQERPLPPAVEARLIQAQQQVEMVEKLALGIRRDGLEREEAMLLGRRQRAELGRRLDELGRRLSKTLGWAGTLAERSEIIRTQRSSGTTPVSEVDAMVWEQAAVDHEEDRARARADEIRDEGDALNDEMSATNERLDHEMLVANAKMEGHIAALRSMALEAWASLEDVAERMGVELPFESA